LPLTVDENGGAAHLSRLQSQTP